MFTELDINLLSVLIAAVAAMAVGFLWYSPFLFGKVWMDLMGYSEEVAAQKKKGMPVKYFVSFLTSLLSGYVLACLIYLTAAETYVDALILGVLIWLGFIATTLLGGVLWHGKPLKLYFITAGYYLAVFLAMSAIIFALI